MACAEPPDPRSLRESPAAASDKRSLYGDPRLVPTREGERIRREIATASEIEQALRIALPIEALRVVVDGKDESRRAAVFLRVPPQIEADEARARADAVVTAIAGATIDRSIAVVVSPDAPPRPARELGVALALALLGLGASMGVTADRLRRRVR
jgi:hypothetical protein